MSTQHTATTFARPGKMAQSQSLNHLLNFSLPPRQAQPLPRRSRKYGTQHGVWNKERELALSLLSADSPLAKRGARLRQRSVSFCDESCWRLHRSFRRSRYVCISHWPSKCILD
jgi:hypothetical protein